MHCAPLCIIPANIFKPINREPVRDELLVPMVVLLSRVCDCSCFTRTLNSFLLFWMGRHGRSTARTPHCYIRDGKRSQIQARPKQPVLSVQNPIHLGFIFGLIGTNRLKNVCRECRSVVHKLSHRRLMVHNVESLSNTRPVSNTRLIPPHAC